MLVIRLVTILLVILTVHYACAKNLLYKFYYIGSLSDEQDHETNNVNDTWSEHKRYHANLIHVRNISLMVMKKIILGSKSI